MLTENQFKQTTKQAACIWLQGN